MRLEMYVFVPIVLHTLISSDPSHELTVRCYCFNESKPFVWLLDLGEAGSILEDEIGNISLVCRSECGIAEYHITNQCQCSWNRSFNHYHQLMLTPNVLRYLMLEAPLDPEEASLAVAAQVAAVSGPKRRKTLDTHENACPQDPSGPVRDIPET